MIETAHRFGGDWTELKLEAISAYSKFMTRAIGATFDLWYVDPFAGTGERTATEQAGGLFEQQPISEIERQYPGSAARALSVDPSFDHFRFGDAKKRHVKALEQLVALYPGKDAQVVHGDANTFIQDMFSRSPWTDRDWGPVRHRALVFLDPYGMEVEWKTLQVLARSQKADVWFLANMKAALQQLSHKHSKLTDAKRAALCEYFGTSDWEEQFYGVRHDETDLLGLIASGGHRRADKHQVAKFHHECLKKLFCYVSEPLALTVGSIDDYFLLYCMSNNPTPAAQDLIKKGAEWVIRRYTQASRRKSARPGGGQ